jgi:hypothetical protein
MFRWYRGAAKCYVYLSDVSTRSLTNSKRSRLSWESAFRQSRWFTRGWTLQELLAPASVKFFSKQRDPLGDKSTLQQEIHEITGIPIKAIQGSPLSHFTVDERIVWAEGRQTKYEEDKVYALQGILDIYILPNYGETKKNALIRLREEISKRLTGKQYVICP